MDLERFGRIGFRVLALAVAMNLTGAILYAATYRSSGSRPVATILIVGGLAAFLAAVVLGVPAAVARVRAIFKPNTGRKGALIFFFGPLLVLIGMELVPHLLNPCGLPNALEKPFTSSICERTSYRGGFQGKGAVETAVDVKDRWHPLAHGLLGAVPLLVVDARVVRRRQARLEPEQVAVPGRPPV